MKRFFYIAALALLAFSACTKVEQVELPARKISFKVANYSATPETRSTSTLTNETTQFYAKAFLHASNGNGGYLATQDMFSAGGDTVRYFAPVAPSTVATWEPYNEYFWPKASESYINFVAWYSANNKSQLVPSAITETSMAWGSNSDPITIVADDNILFADEAWHYTDNAQTYQYDAVEKGVPILFHHALAKVAFNLKLKTTKASARSIWKVEIQSANLTVANNGYLTLANSYSGSTAAQRAWTVGGSEAGSTIVGWARPSTGATTETITLTDGGFQGLTFTNFKPVGASVENPVSSASQEFLAMRTVMPQTLGSTVTFGLTFRISIYHADASGNQVGETPYSVEVVEIPAQRLDALSSISDWNMNTKITYNISIDPVGKKVLFDPAVVAWTTIGPSNATLINE